MDLSAIKIEPLDIEIKHPATDEPTGLVFTLMSAQDPAAGRARRALQDRMQRNKGVLSEEASTDFLVDLIVGWKWNGDATWGTEGKLAFTTANVRKVLAVPGISPQLESVLLDHKAFFSK
jgi:hypothetical protein